MVTQPAATRQSIAGIAARFQFTASELSRAFRTRYGMSPRQARHYGQMFRDVGEPDGIDRRYE
jgi:AraC-like DNA-binding protein